MHGSYQHCEVAIGAPMSVPRPACARSAHSSSAARSAMHSLAARSTMHAAREESDRTWHRPRTRTRTPRGPSRVLVRRSAARRLQGDRVGPANRYAPRTGCTLSTRHSLAARSAMHAARGQPKPNEPTANAIGRTPLAFRTSVSALDARRWGVVCKESALAQGVRPRGRVQAPRLLDVSRWLVGLEGAGAMARDSAAAQRRVRCRCICSRAARAPGPAERVC